MTTIKAVDVIHLALPTRREHKWTGARDPIGRYVLVRVTGDDGMVGWGEAPVLKDWGGDHGRYYGETPGTTAHVVRRYLAPAVQGAMVGDFAAPPEPWVGAAVAAGRWGIDRLRVYTSLHTANGSPLTTQPSGPGASTVPPPDAGQVRTSGGPEPGRPKTSPRADVTRDAGGPSRDPSTPPTANERDSTTDESRPG